MFSKREGEEKQGEFWIEMAHRVEAIERLNGALFIHTEDRSVGKRAQIETNDVGRLGLEVAIIALQLVVPTVGLQPSLGPDSGHAHVVDAKLHGQLAALQCVEPSAGLRWSVQSRMRASIFSLPGWVWRPRWRLKSPGTRCARNRSRQRHTVFTLHCSARLISRRL